MIKSISMQSSTIVKISKLSPREQEVADLIIKGISTNDISKKLNIPEFGESSVYGTRAKYRVVDRYHIHYHALTNDVFSNRA